jgi:hypothetical protein
LTLTQLLAASMMLDHCFSEGVSFWLGMDAGEGAFVRWSLFVLFWCSSSWRHVLTRDTCFFGLF